jgi:glycine hydroxymethyltransferase
MPFMYDAVAQEDQDVYALIRKEEERQKEGLEMIPSENYASLPVLEALGSVFNDKYAENYPGARYYGSCGVVDELERLAQSRALSLFKADGYKVNVQPYSGSPANMAAYLGLLTPGDTIMALRLDHGGHLTHGSPVSMSGKLFHFVHYELDASGVLDYSAILELAKKEKPKLIISGFTAYPRQVDFKRMAEIAKEVGAISMVDMSHVSGLVAGGVHPSPFPFADIVTSTTHKTLRGPRGAMIFSKEPYTALIDKAVFPGMQGGPHEHAIAALAVALKEAADPSFVSYAKQVVLNARALAETLIAEGFTLVSGGTDTHLLLLDLRPFGPGRGVFAEKMLEASHVSVNKNPVPNDSSPPFYPSGIRMGTPALTSRGMKEDEMREIGMIIVRVLREAMKTALPDDKESRKEAVRLFAESLRDHPLVLETQKQVRAIASRFPVPGILA